MASIGEVLTHAWKIHQSGNIDAAMKLYRGVLEQIPDSAEAWVYLGIGQFDQRDFVGSVASYRRALKIRDRFPIAWNNLGNSLRMLGEIDEAERCFEKALSQQPDYLSALKNRGTLWVWNGDVERGLKWYQRGLQIDPNNAELHRNLGVISLLMGDYARGFDEFRWRWRMPGVARPPVSAWWQSAGIHVPVWSGQPLENRKIIIYPEQGLGDAIHFIRVASALHQSGASVIVVCQASMLPLFASVPGIDELVADDQSGGVVHPSLMQADYQGSFIEILDGLFQRDGQIYFGEELFESPGSATPHGKGYLRVDDAAVERWSAWMDRTLASSETGGAEVGGLVVSGSPTRLPRIGINWQGNREHHADVYRSVRLEVFRPLIESDRFQLINMQFGHGIEQLESADYRDKVLRLPATLDQSVGRFVDTAAVLRGLDALVTTDTAIAHLAGALGVRTHLLLGRVPDWRWLMNGTSTRWYPNTRITRQSEFGQWDEPVSEIIEQVIRF
ncbi:tetratricopeptide repeat protein [Neorhodopirellula pilleata]|uniref:Tetratricopeptide repeat protein n=1 Tax=Neorhodopirellula pilleata TaxID=2714738 RepID=A0A5C6AR55_9BACT|nr:tetratricopeptide repeat-containing glycosyltransferase family protein [Neorhodopirellula pilleata]TWU01546.1 Tetratricopeptide repeat protein [Neorhodopirellula pilleata]